MSTPHQLTSNVKLLQKIVLEHDDKVLLLQRDPDSASRPGCWDLPGGNSEWPEHLTEPTSDLHQVDAWREILEETGLDIAPESFTRDNLAYFETFFDPEKQIFTVLCGWHLIIDSPETPRVNLSDEHTAFKWLKLKNALEQDFGGGKGAFVARILESTQQ